ncbi:MAG: hypothetical protein AB7S74_17290 [Hyphomicrobium sp.]
MSLDKEAKRYITQPTHRRGQRLIADHTAQLAKLERRGAVEQKVIKLLKEFEQVMELMVRHRGAIQRKVKPQS